MGDMMDNSDDVFRKNTVFWISAIIILALVLFGAFFPNLLADRKSVV